MITGPQVRSSRSRARRWLAARRNRWAAAVAATTLGLTAAATAGAVATPDADHPARTAAVQPVHDVIANLWEWNWNSIATECNDHLGPAGYGGVQVAPPQDSLSRDYTSSDAPILHPWWEVYQPVDYHLTSRMGTEAEFRQMVTTCRAAGVKVYVDAVINHMTGQGHVSYGGVQYTKYNYPGLYSPNNFHATTGQCPTASGGIEDYNVPRQVWKCELVGLADLRTETPYVRTQLVRYLNKLIGYGVSGFRVDAAKHIGETDLLAIYNRLHDTADGHRPFFALEVFPGGPGVLTPQAFEVAGTPLGFDFAYQIKNAFKSYTNSGGAISSLRVFGEAAGLLPSDKTLVFVENHDTERGSDTLSYKDGKTNVLADQFMLAYGYGTPEVYAAFAFINSYDSPPSDASGHITNTACNDTTWVCVDRYPAVANLVGFHNYVGNAPLRNWWDDGGNAIAFSRGDRGWVALNNGTTDITRTFTTGLPKGTYCDLSHGAVSGGTCTGPTIRVNANGRASLTVPAKEAVAIDRSALAQS